MLKKRRNRCDSGAFLLMLLLSWKIVPYGLFSFSMNYLFSTHAVIFHGQRAVLLALGYRPPAPG